MGSARGSCFGVLDGRSDWRRPRAGPSFATRALAKSPSRRRPTRGRTRARVLPRDVAHVRGDGRSNVSAGASASESESKSESESVVGGFAESTTAALRLERRFRRRRTQAFQQADYAAWNVWSSVSTPAAASFQVPAHRGHDDPGSAGRGGRASGGGAGVWTGLAAQALIARRAMAALYRAPTERARRKSRGSG